ncbi:uncharacterized protein LOC143723435 [Siphateles boraxobius]|uniref:uncharacterized protein LOC143723435 n=1 Tax=Siphateles boraxobius TaxID=180520 RepID=UPI00406326A8
MTVKGIKIILLLVVIEHSCSDNNNDSDCNPYPCYSNSSTTYKNSDCCEHINGTMEATHFRLPVREGKMEDKELLSDLQDISDSSGTGEEEEEGEENEEEESSSQSEGEEEGESGSESKGPEHSGDMVLEGRRFLPDMVLEGRRFLPERMMERTIILPDSDSCLDISPTDSKIPQGFTAMWNISAKSAEFLKGLIVTSVMPSFYILVILISLPLNAFALVTFTCRIKVKKPSVIYMSHLACVDLFFTLLLPLKIHYQLNASDWVFGEVACRVVCSLLLTTATCTAPYF